MARKRASLKPRIMGNVEIDSNGCWIWQGNFTRDGYPVFTIGRKQHRVHRVAYELFKKPIRGNNFVCHKCDTPSCVNPQHLFQGSPKDNTLDMIRKGRANLPRDLGHWKTKISHAERVAVMEMRQSGLTLKEIANKYGVSFQCISAICNEVGSYGQK